ncbi:hypothetical protein [Roseobacter sinensis]|uniref:Yip1 domain-containing protein n=1 Tax=Roseobacter sinensis TaxID=2931391 RepID=A0ABT3BB77_9RHOB|nr:hypothetical protein [Roseobacter sp. WL0113]MCV3270805.1 hypothetical protein [Roseobacter sp. WL0113]
MLGILGLLLAVLDYFNVGRRFNQRCTQVCRRVFEEALDLATLGWFSPAHDPRDRTAKIYLAIPATTFCVGAVIACVRLIDGLQAKPTVAALMDAAQTFLHDLLVAAVWAVIMLFVFSTVTAVALILIAMLKDFRTFSVVNKLVCILLVPIWLPYLLISLLYALGFVAVFGALFGIGYLISLPPKGFLATAGIIIAALSLI